MIQFIADKEIIIDLKIAIYSINFNAAVILIDLVNSKKIGNVEILMSNLRNKAHREKEEIIKDLFTDHKNIKLFFCSSHAKIFSCKTKKITFTQLKALGTCLITAGLNNMFLIMIKECTYSLANGLTK